MSEVKIIAEIYALLMLGAGGCMIPGWLLNRPDGARRFTWRLVTWLLVLVAFSFFSLNLHGWHWWLNLGMVMLGLSKVGEWWKKLELVRRFEREVRRARGVRK